ncbi:alpha/beta fold hydrolase [Dactylosporangium vinaceum]|uniref:Alpha/beta fold hydrolase n=1 Tax=Dactylosporangium vinaceum TaxID=53362 RepID=A0ABV5M2S5_9ACTN|nr:alpha/beta hydrolase [Dactylosporangium vinaceum]
MLSNGVRLAYERSGAGEPVLFIMGSGAAGRVWTVHQTPALHRAGFETITFDNRGIPPSDVPAGQYRLDDMVADTRGLIEALGLAPCRIVGTSLGALIAQQLTLESPHLVRCAVLLATRGRSDVTRQALTRAERALAASGLQLPDAYRAAKSVLEMLSPATLNRDAEVTSWLEVFEMSGGRSAAGRGQSWVELPPDHLAALRGVTVPCRVVAFADDVIAPPHLCAEVAEAIPGCDYTVIADCGHLGHLERPDEVNRAILEFIDKY